MRGQGGRAMTARDVAAAARLMTEHWGERIVERRLGLGLSQEDLAQRIGTNQQQVSKWENGLQEPRLATKYAIAEALAISADVLFPLYP